MKPERRRAEPQAAARRPRPAFRVVALLLASLLCAGLVEGVLRLAPSLVPLAVLEQFDPPLRNRVARGLHLPTREDTRLVPRKDGGPADILWVYRAHTEVTWAVDEPGIERTVRMDADGFCNPPRREGRDHTAALVAIGDSLTFCTAVTPSATWVALIDDEVEGGSTNLALPGRGPYEYLEMLEAVGLDRRPRVVVMTIYEGNDFRDAAVFHSGRAGGAAAAGAACPGGGLACRGAVAVRAAPLLQDSLAANFLAGGVIRLSHLARKREIDFRYEVALPDGTTLQLNSRNGDRDEVEHARALADGRLGTGVFEEALARFARLACDHRFEPVLVYIPSAYTAYDARARFDDADIHALMRSYSRTLRAWFAEAAVRHRLHYLDSTDALARAADTATREDPVYFPANVHLTPGGHRVVAREVRGLLEGRSLLQTTTPGQEPGRRACEGR